MLKRKKGKSERARVIRALDQVTPKIIKLRDEYTCQRCGGKPSPRGCHWAHVKSRSDYRLRWDLLNALTLCYGCHQYWHGHPREFTKWFEGYWPARATYLRQLNHEHRRTIHTSELKQLLERHKNKLKQLERR